MSFPYILQTTNKPNRKCFSRFNPAIPWGSGPNYLEFWYSAEPAASSAEWITEHLLRYWWRCKWPNRYLAGAIIMSPFQFCCKMQYLKTTISNDASHYILFYMCSHCWYTHRGISVRPQWWSQYGNHNYSLTHIFPQIWTPHMQYEAMTAWELQY